MAAVAVVVAAIVDFDNMEVAFALEFAAESNSESLVVEEATCEDSVR